MLLVVVQKHVDVSLPQFEQNESDPKLPICWSNDTCCQDCDLHPFSALVWFDCSRQASKPSTMHVELNEHTGKE